MRDRRYSLYLCTILKGHVNLRRTPDRVAQQVEQVTVNHWVGGSTPSFIAKGQVAKWKGKSLQNFDALVQSQFWPLNK